MYMVWFVRQRRRCTNPVRWRVTDPSSCPRLSVGIRHPSDCDSQQISEDVGFLFGTPILTKIHTWRKRWILFFLGTRLKNMHSNIIRVTMCYWSVSFYFLISVLAPQNWSGSDKKKKKTTAHDSDIVFPTLSSFRPCCFLSHTSTFLGSVKSQCLHGLRLQTWALPSI